MNRYLEVLQQNLGNRYLEVLQQNPGICNLNRLPPQGYPVIQQNCFNGKTVYPIVHKFPVIDTWNQETPEQPHSPEKKSLEKRKRRILSLETSLIENPKETSAINCQPLSCTDSNAQPFQSATPFTVTGHPVPRLYHCQSSLPLGKSEGSPTAGRKLQMGDSSGCVENEAEFPDINSLSICKKNTTEAISFEKQTKLHHGHPVSAIPLWTAPSLPPPIALPENAIRKLHHPHQKVGERQEIFDYIKTLQNKWLTASILAFHTNKRSGTACYENKCSPYSIKFIFKVPEKYKMIPPTELTSRYKGLSGQLGFNENQLSKYIVNEQPGNFRGARLQESKRIPINCTNVQLTRSWTLPEW